MAKPDRRGVGTSAGPHIVTVKVSNEQLSERSESETPSCPDPQRSERNGFYAASLSGPSSKWEDFFKQRHLAALAPRRQRVVLRLTFEPEHLTGSRLGECGGFVFS